MAYSISVQLKKTAPTDIIESILKDSKFLEKNKSIYISRTPKENVYSVNYDNGLYIDFNPINNYEFYFIHCFFKQIAELYSERIINPKDQKEYAFYNYENEIILLIPENDYIENRNKYKEFSTENGIVVSDDYMDKLFEKTNEKIQIDNIKNFSFDYLMSKPYQREYSVPNFIVNLFSNENKIFKEIFKNIKSIEKEIIKRQKNKIIL